jgi:hypothetical protein
MNAPSSWVKLTRLRLWVGGAIFAQFFQGKIGLRSLKRRAAYAIRCAAEYQGFYLLYFLQNFGSICNVCCTQTEECCNNNCMMGVEI